MQCMALFVFADGLSSFALVLTDTFFRDLCDQCWSRESGGKSHRSVEPVEFGGLGISASPVLPDNGLCF